MRDTNNDISRRTALKYGAATAAALTIGGAATGSAAADIGDGRVLDFHLNNLNYDREKGQIVAGHVHDASPAKNHGEWSDEDYAGIVVDGPVGRAFSFANETLDDSKYVTVPDASSLDIQDELTIAFWFRLDGLSPDNAFPRAVSKGQTTTEDGAYGVYIEDGNGDPNRIGLRFVGTDGVTRDVDARGLPRFDDGEWHHVAATYSNAADEGVLYFDNTVAETTSFPGDIQIRANDAPLTVGAGFGDGARHLNGSLDEVRVYDRALAGADVAELYQMRV